MFGFLVGWGVFWMLLWITAFIVGVVGKSDGLMGFGLLGTILSVIFLISVTVGRVLSGI